MKGAVAAMLSVARAFEETAGPAPDVGFVFTTDEETGGEATLFEALDTFETLPQACLIGEMSGTPDRPSVAIADKGSIWLTLQSCGEPAHGSRPVLGANAIDTLYDTIDKLREELQAHQFDLHPDVDRILTQSVAYYAPTIGEKTAWDLFESPTVNLGTFSGGTAINSVPVSAAAKLDIRLTASVAVEPIVQRLRSYITGIDGVEIASLEWSKGTYEQLDAPLVTAVQTAGESVLDSRLFARSATGGGDAKTLRQQGISTVEFALGTETAYAVDERTTVTALSQTAKIYGAIPLLWSEK
ncbi:M20 family metallopeptidase (plasmid) [Haloarcula marismortui]|uniref:M20 family metallopeptidase n=1 Tax=Haloarcula marismortui TaxID=2238 RepID=UPI003C787C1A